ncbi:MAG: class I SAM-dependent RNA methyltransferase [Spirochaetes bacterium]|nr:class I SAM-dependent RNA methyltransferase [Spirochaetota bacterium]MBU1079228.1 class I SAM-dependent RNA methyltransferase [Spirochaetota bacterium]
METTMRISASCAVGIEKVLAGELERLGIAPGTRSAGRVSFETDKAGLARALVGLRTADRLFLVAGTFPAKDFDQLFDGFNAIPWERWVGPRDRLVIEKAKSIRSALSAQNSIQSVGQKAAYDRLCAEYGVNRMPETGETVMTRVRVEGDIAAVELDLCGEALSRRGYRKRPTEAPLKESVAAAVLFLSGWRRSFALYDPFCGSGTIPIEAALYAFDIAPGLGRGFSWERMPDGGAKEVAAAKERARAAVDPTRDVMIAGSDADQAALDAALANAGLAGVGDRIRFFRARAEEAAPFEERGFIVTDPPYGKRLGTPAEADALYASLGAFSGRFARWELCFVVDREEFGGFAGERAVPKAAGAWKRTKIVDGAETRWLHRSIAGGASR